ncbi:MAG: hypothetical protein EPO46_03165 [Lysobacter sp.]|nr:MAG: hypothetical protein EPO46_03165 [Lysobacter sp.]
MKSPYIGLAATLLAGCASTHAMPDRVPVDSAQLALYRQHAGAAVPRFRYAGHLVSWTPLGPHTLAVRTGRRQAYLLELSGPCPDLEFAPAVSVTDSLGSVSTHFDRVIPLGTGANVPCPIAEIRPLDLAAIHAAERARTAGTP